MALVSGSTPGADTLIGLGTNDIFTVNNLGDVVVELFNGSSVDTVNSSVTYTLTENVEILTLAAGTSAINGTGNEIANTLNGNEGSNVLDGAEGNDTLNGNGGIDTLYGGSGDDKLNGGTGNDFLYGGTGKDTLNGGGDNDFLDGGFDADSLTGGAGDDIYVVSASSGQAAGSKDTVTEAFNAGTDTVQAAFAASGTAALNVYTLDANVENLVLLGDTAINGTGNTLNNILTGNSAANTLTGLAGDDTLSGGAGADSLDGGAGNDILDGGTGTDTLTGGADNDIFYVNTVNDVVLESVGGGTDEVRSTATSYTLSNAQNIENLTLQGAAYKGTGNDLANVITGTASINVLIGGGGNDTLDGGLGADDLQGGLGDDTYIVNTSSGAGASADVVTEASGEGTDTVRASFVVSATPALNVYTLTSNVENLVLTGSAAINGTGNGVANFLTGNSGKNTLDGLGGNDILNGGTVDGQVDTLKGGDGDDTYLIDVSSGATGADIITESTADVGGTPAIEGGTDIVKSSVTYSLAAVANVENLTLTNWDAAGNVPAAGVGTLNLNGTGNALANVITGNNGDNILNGGAADGLTDTLFGGLGNDTYVVDATNLGVAPVGVDSITESTADVGGTAAIEGGTDLVSSSASYTLGSLSNVENLTLTGTAGTGIGNSLINTITGNASANILDGGAGDGAKDVLAGGAGNDTYFVTATNVGSTVGVDTINESAGAANGAADLINSSVSYSLATIVNVENLTLTNATSTVASADNGGTAAINGTGNSLINTITGNAGVNILNGGANDLKADILVGNAGSDTYIVDATNVSTATGYLAAAVDTITETGADASTNGLHDLVQSSVTYSLASVAFVEDLTLTKATAIDGTGNTLDNIILGGEGDNKLAGLTGDDTLNGNGGKDTLTGGTGADTLTGGLGADTFVYTADTDSPAGDGDTITDFTIAQSDKIDLRSLDAIPATAVSVGVPADAWTFLADATTVGELTNAGGTQGAIVFTTDGTDGLLSFETASGTDGEADYEIVLTGVTSLDASVFLGILV